ncbi:MAG: zinc ABC transporter substrate-binding protein [Polyangiaceae bacterium]|nr:zinc ABC transporter substrate-binding protein [Polyangiaceae bacterium]
MSRFPSRWSPPRGHCRLPGALRWLLALAVAWSLTGAPDAAHAALRVVTTTPDLAAITQAVGAGRVEVTALAAATQDPHFVDARPNLALALAKAGLLVEVGADLEVGWLPTLLTGSRNGTIQRGARGWIDASTLVALLEIPAGKVDRAMGDIHPQGNPHFLLDPRRAERVAVGIGKRLAELDPAGHQAYLDAAKRFVADLRTARTGWESRLATLRGKPIVGYHRSLAYLADWLGLVVVEHLEPKPGIPPSPRHVADVVNVGKARQVGLLVQESWYPTTTSSVAATNMGARLVVIPGMTNFARGQSYHDFLATVVARLETER